MAAGGVGARLLQDYQSQLASFVQKEVAGAGPSQIADKLASADVQIAVLRHALVSSLLFSADDGEPTEEAQEVLEQLILLSKECVQALILSGGCSNWGGAIEVLCNIHNLDPDWLASEMRIRLAVAVALCFAEGETDPNMQEQPIDPLLRYHNFCQWAETGQLFHEFSSLRSWQQRYVVGSWHADDCLEWARVHVKEDVRCPELIGQAARMVSYRLHNASGVSVQEGLRFYDGQKSTMPVILQYGGVCGAVSKFGASACQSFGVPAMPVGQPGHCAMIWRGPGGLWIMENGNAGMVQSKMHAGIQRTWRCLGLEGAAVIPVMERAQALFPDYATSEAIRLAAPWCCGDQMPVESRTRLLAEAVKRCPYNLPAWADLLAFARTSATSEVAKALQGFLASTQTAIAGERKPRNLARFRPVRATSDEANAPNLVDGTSSEWFPTSSEPQQIEVDLLHPSEIEAVRIQWWGDYGTKTSLNVSSSADGSNFVDRGQRTSNAEFNGWTTLAGWAGEETRVLRLSLDNPHPDCFGLKKQYGLRQVEVLGYATLPEDDTVPPETLAANWAELLFCSTSQADVLALGLVKGMAGVPSNESAEAIPCCIS